MLIIYKQPLFGFDVHYVAPANPYHPSEVVTTIDKSIQEFVTKALKKKQELLKVVLLFWMLKRAI
ncbi:hypothetical protein KHA80_04345 [Anaerobacillus sp. HL2]|nr:hypothetical protein KHA80_04345 [Anaerobacillus sp. HL2]